MEYQDTTDPAIKNIRMICNNCDRMYTGHISSICPECHSRNTQSLSDVDLPNDYDAIGVE